MFPEKFQRTIKKRIFGNNAGEIKQIHRNSDVRMCIFSRHQIIRPVDMEVREGSCCQIGWIYGKVPKGGGGVIFNQKIYIADFGNIKLGFLIMKLIQSSNFRVQGMLFQQLYWEKSKQDTLWRRHVHAFHTIWPSYLRAYMQPCPL